MLKCPVLQRLGIIGRSGLDKSGFIDRGEILNVKTPYGESSSPLESGAVGGKAVVFLARHGLEHEIPPHRINHKANLWALREADVSGVVSTSSVGSLKEGIRPGELVVPDDFLCPWDIPTYREEEVVHVTPELDPALRRLLLEAAGRAGIPAHDGGVYVQTTGPRLETKAEIRMFREFGDVVGMTMASEATLARELEVPYASVCSVDNYCHGIIDEALTYDQIVAVQRENADVLRRVLRALLEGLE